MFQISEKNSTVCPHTLLSSLPYIHVVELLITLSAHFKPISFSAQHPTHCIQLHMNLTNNSHIHKHQFYIVYISFFLWLPYKSKADVLLEIEDELVLAKGPTKEGYY